MNEFWKRTLSGAIYVGVVVSSILYHPVFYGIAFSLIILLAVREYHHLTKMSRVNTIMSAISAILLFVTCWIPVGMQNYCYGFLMTICFVLYCLMLISSLVIELWLKSDDPIQNWGKTLQSQVMIALPIAMMSALMFFDKYLLLTVFVLIWVNDSGAYCVGVLSSKMPGGNHKMFPRVSPKKSWEGLFGGFLFAIAASILIAHLGWYDWLIQHSSINMYVIAIVFAIVVAVAGTLGDLMESLLKRTIGVKDSGRFLPGHGGVLDRFDSILLAVPAALLLVIIL